MLQLELDLDDLEVASPLSIYIIVEGTFTVVEIYLKFDVFGDLIVIFLNCFDVCLVKIFSEALNIVLRPIDRLTRTIRGLTGTTLETLSPKAYPKTPRLLSLSKTTMLSTLSALKKTSKIEL